MDNTGLFSSKWKKLQRDNPGRFFGKTDTGKRLLKISFFLSVEKGELSENRKIKIQKIPNQEKRVFFIFPVLIGIF